MGPAAHGLFCLDDDQYGGADGRAQEPFPHIQWCEIQQAGGDGPDHDGPVEREGGQGGVEAPFVCQQPELEEGLFSARELKTWKKLSITKMVSARVRAWISG